MKRALWLAQSRGRYVSPNPKVGAVLVKNGVIIGEGAHERYGGPHAEVIAIQKAGLDAKGATLYVTLEPCSHYGKTPPCAQAIIQAGIQKVVAAMRDPNPLVAGRGFKGLKESGIRVERGPLKMEAQAMNENFIFSLRHQRPKVILKAAMTLDGKIATAAGKSKWITGAQALVRSHRMRSQVDAILVGSRTALMDDPSLTVRLRGFRRTDGWPLRVLLDTHLRVKPSARLFQGTAQTIVFASPKASGVRENALKRKGIRVFRVPLQKKMLSLETVLQVLNTLSVRSLLVEGGAQVHASFLQAKLADSLALFIAPKIFGGPSLAWVGGSGVLTPEMAWKAQKIHIEPCGEDYLLSAQLRD